MHKGCRHMSAGTYLCATWAIDWRLGLGVALVAVSCVLPISGSSNRIFAVPLPAGQTLPPDELNKLHAAGAGSQLYATMLQGRAEASQVRLLMHGHNSQTPAALYIFA
jgi:hypothetical protein